MTKPKEQAKAFRESRNASVSRDRLAVERFLLGLADGETVTRQDIRNKISITAQQAMYILSALRVDGFAINKAEGKHSGQWCASEKARNPHGLQKPSHSGHRKIPENGTPEYWSKNHACAMGTPRL